MNDPDWSLVAETLHASGFAVSYARVSHDPANPLWKAEASRDGRKWTVLGKFLASTMLELERQTRDSADWRAMIPHESGSAVSGL